MWRWLLALVFSAASLAQDTATGQKIFVSQCALCHGVSGGGGRGPALTRAKLDHASDDAALKNVIENGLPPDMPGAWQLSPREVLSVASYVKSLSSVPPETLSGDPARGAAIYQAKGCATCHINHGSGEGFGPELTDIGKKRSAAFLREAIRNPASSLPDRFVYVIAATTTGETLRGIRMNEDTFTLQMKDVRGQFHSLRKADLKSLQKSREESPMPGYATELTAAELEDLVAYLAGLRGKT
jgi:cytochrome c oxidase cbb3-type subunit 3